MILTPVKQFMLIIMLVGFAIHPKSVAGTVLIASGYPIGGSGDVASNMLMAEKIHESLPLEDVIILVVPESAQVISALEPRFLPGLSSQVIEGITYLSEPFQERKNLERPTLFLGFSNNFNNPTIKKFWSRATLALGFYEYQGTHPINPGEFIDRDFTSVFNTGIYHSGLYVSKDRPSTDFISSPNLAELRQLLADTAFDAVSRLPGGRIAFAHAAEYKSIRWYIESTILTVGSSETIIFVPRRFIKFFTKLPNNIHLADSSIPFKQSRQLMMLSNLPVLVTGDVSLSIALDYEIPFVYEARQHKENFAIDLLKIFPHLKVLHQFEVPLPELLEGEARDSLFSNWRPIRRYLSLPEKIATIFHSLDEKKHPFSTFDFSKFLRKPTIKSQCSKIFEKL